MVISGDSSRHWTLYPRRGAASSDRPGLRRLPTGIQNNEHLKIFVGLCHVYEAGGVFILRGVTRANAKLTRRWCPGLLQICNSKHKEWLEASRLFWCSQTLPLSLFFTFCYKFSLIMTPPPLTVHSEVEAFRMEVCWCVQQGVNIAGTDQLGGAWNACPASANWSWWSRRGMLRSVSVLKQFSHILQLHDIQLKFEEVLLDFGATWVNLIRACS